MRWTCTRHVGRAPMGPPNSPAATYLCANRALSGNGWGTSGRSQARQAQPNPNRWPGQRDRSHGSRVRFATGTAPAEANVKGGRGRGNDLHSASFGKQSHLGRVSIPDQFGTNQRKRQRRGQGPCSRFENPSGQAMPCFSDGRSAAKSVHMSRAMQSNPTWEVSYHLMPSMRRNQVY